MTTALATAVLAQAPAPPPPEVGLGETVVFWILGPLALLGALGMVFARNAVHSALWLVLTMLSLGVLYMAQSAPFLGFTQIIVYTGAIMMLFLFVLMMVGRDAGDSVVEVLRGQRLAAALAGIGLALLLVSGLAGALTQVRSAAPLDPWSPQGGGAGGLGRIIFTDYLFPFELTSALLITAAVGAMVLAYGGKGRGPRYTQREMAEARFRSGRPSPLPGPGVYATADSVATPALLPDGSIAPDSLSKVLETTFPREIGTDPTPRPDAHALTGGDGVAVDPSSTGSRPAHQNGHVAGGESDTAGSEQSSEEEVRQ